MPLKGAKSSRELLLTYLVQRSRLTVLQCASVGFGRCMVTGCYPAISHCCPTTLFTPPLGLVAPIGNCSTAECSGLQRDSELADLELQEWLGARDLKRGPHGPDMCVRRLLTLNGYRLPSSISHCPTTTVFSPPRFSCSAGNCDTGRVPLTPETLGYRRF